MRIVLMGVLSVLSGCPSVDLGDTPSDIGACQPNGGAAYFAQTIWPSYLAIPAPLDPTHTCLDMGCHGNGSVSGGLGFDTAHPGSIDNYHVAQVALDCQVPKASWLLTKPLAGIDAHRGGDLFRTTDPQYATFLAWFQ
jgi:hypothetical protein